MCSINKFRRRRSVVSGDQFINDKQPQDLVVFDLYSTFECYTPDWSFRRSKKEAVSNQQYSADQHLWFQEFAISYFQLLGGESKRLVSTTGYW